MELALVEKIKKPNALYFRSNGKIQPKKITQKETRHVAHTWEKTYANENYLFHGVSLNTVVGGSAKYTGTLGVEAGGSIVDAHASPGIWLAVLLLQLPLPVC